ncbi:MAG TPA: hypothetical protein VJS88_01835 [Chthoniobacterales bacterium]|nr:hypothetical protein [Chthoniobacterales bacterium]
MTGDISVPASKRLAYDYSTKMQTILARLCLVFLIVTAAPQFASARDLGWQPAKTWVFVVGVLGWKHSDMYGSFPVKNRRDNALIDFFR